MAEERGFKVAEIKT